jgi:hypothetical protein
MSTRVSELADVIVPVGDRLSAVCSSNFRREGAQRCAKSL